ncbi:ThiF family adenylyltransferase [Flammeovirga yaeyamensis]|uniref:ThiF family adenylyltransferase n=1 Tax=Flammeovirga yaeyamensis TaxID=367791 RepID=A0AAX1N7J2_9BACT|nr:tRNA threonylcarbamoyladenosine dehydratase [Flammeovirga yaeyamensis]MBB3697776.1 tRNA A37 threonylcarbamoyladenosine dehydratase [Flammeovirga yaeyamensis]NMF35868.1 tRNA threonylcarbamoyladenosine dehydratase [Flammeovirga yaeyamensis]QWG03182.1 ThiF family adenylyltransferase [Flammeovirga yaeyamensis]
MGHWQERTELLVGTEGLDTLGKAHVLIIGVGGVGGFAAEAIGRAGVGKITLVDGDVIEQSNRNRQIAALISTDGMPKAEVIGNRIKDVNPNVDLDVQKIYLDGENIKELLLAHKYDYVIECIDTLAPKMDVIRTAIQNNIKIVSSMGAGGRMDPTQTKVARLKDTYNCQLAQKIRKRIKEKSIKRKLKVVYSPELIDKSKVKTVEGVLHKASTIGTISYMPAVFGLTCASVAIRGILED